MHLSRVGIAHLKEQIDAHGIAFDSRDQRKYDAAVTERGSAQYLEPFAEASFRGSASRSSVSRRPCSGRSS